MLKGGSKRSFRGQKPRVSELTLLGLFKLDSVRASRRLSRHHEGDSWKSTAHLPAVLYCVQIRMSHQVHSVVTNGRFQATRWRQQLMILRERVTPNAWISTCQIHNVLVNTAQLQNPPVSWFLSFLPCPFFVVQSRQPTLLLERHAG